MEKAREALLCNIQDHLAMTTVVLIRRGQPCFRFHSQSHVQICNWEPGSMGMGTIWNGGSMGMGTIWNGDNLEWGQSGMGTI